MIDEGYTKFRVEWTDRHPIDDPATVELDRWRGRLFRAGLVGHYAHLGIGYGNVSVRARGARQFVISGTQTGHLSRTGPEHYALVTDYAIDDNLVVCRGATQASSETLTHAAIYELDESILAVAHVHDERLWQQLKNRMPTTDAQVSYGTPAMAREFARLWRETTLPSAGVAVMAGHESGIVSIGVTLEEAVTRILRLAQPFSVTNREYSQ